MKPVIQRNLISSKMGAICFEASMLAETGATNWHTYNIGHSEVALRVEASIDQDDWTHYDVELIVDNQKIRRSFKDVPYAVKFLTAKIADIHRRNGYRVVKR